MKRTYLMSATAIACLFLLASCATPTGGDKMLLPRTTLPEEAGPWLTSYDAALAESGKSGKPVLAYFTAGSSDPWAAPWCWKLNQEVFETNRFRAWAEKNVVLLKLHYPFRRPQDEATKKANAELARKYEIEGCPTVILMKSDGTKIGTMDYMRGGAEPWIEHAQKILDENK